MTHLRRAMLEELQRRGYATTTVQCYIQTVEEFAKCFRKSPDRLDQQHVRTFQTDLLGERKLHPRSVKRHVAALRSFFVKKLRRPYGLDDTSYSRVPRRLPTILTVEEVTRLINAARTLSGGWLQRQQQLNRRRASGQGTMRPVGRLNNRAVVIGREPCSDPRTELHLRLEMAKSLRRPHLSCEGPARNVHGWLQSPQPTGRLQPTATTVNWTGGC